ncbi:hypothetical protein EVA_10137 [gut metagenome]|uniref:Uncharacterized protein n=1 Tax=gut metagenome TaxID=749906 RepID=J9GIH2_9ZZZZ
MYRKKKRHTRCSFISNSNLTRLLFNRPIPLYISSFVSYR